MAPELTPVPRTLSPTLNTATHFPLCQAGGRPPSGGRPDFLPQGVELVHVALVPLLRDFSHGARAGPATARTGAGDLPVLRLAGLQFVPSHVRSLGHVVPL